MANPSFVQGAKKIASASSTTLAFGSNNTATNLLIAVVRCNNPLATPVVSDPHNTWVLLDTQTIINAEVDQFWYVLNCAAGANTVTLTDTSGLSSVVEFLLGEYQSGISGGILALDAHTSTKGSASVPASGNCTTNFANDLLIGWTGNNAGTTITAGLIGGGTALLQENQSNVLAYEDNNAANNTAGPNAASFGGSQITWSCGVAAFKVNMPAPPSSSGGGLGSLGLGVGLGPQGKWECF